MVLELLPVYLGVHEHAGQIVGGSLAARGDQLAATREHLGHELVHQALDPGGVEVGVAGPECRVHELRPHRVVLGWNTHEAADDARDDGLRHVRDEIAAIAVVQSVEHLARDATYRILVGGDPLGREARLKERLDAVVLGRVHADEHRPGELQRQHAAGGDAPAFGGVGAPVAADGVDVLGRRHRPEAGIVGTVGELPEALGSMDRTLGTHAPEHVVRRTVLPQRVLRQFNVTDIAFDGRHVNLPRSWPNYVLSRWEDPVGRSGFRRRAGTLLACALREP